MSTSSWKRRLIAGLAIVASFNLGLFARPYIDSARQPEPFARLESAVGINQPGVNGAPKVFVAFDPYCSYCHKLYSALVKRVEAGELQVKWVPVAFMQPDSLNVASEMLSAADPATSLSKWFGTEAGISPVLPMGVSPENHEPSVAANTHLIRRLVGRNAAPALFYRDESGDVQATVGVPADLDGWLRGLCREH
jgi:thiol:disulfide interchange protein DsbG